jgi:hypothetical protein
MTDTVPVSRQRLHDVLECLDVALRNFEDASSFLDETQIGVKGDSDEYALAQLEQGVEHIDTAHLLVKAVRQSLDDALTTDALIGRKPRPGDRLDGLRASIPTPSPYSNVRWNPNTPAGGSFTYGPNHPLGKGVLVNVKGADGATDSGPAS